MGQLLAGALIVLGWIMNNLIVVMAGLSVFAAAHLEDQGVLLQTKVDSVRMKDVMLTEFSTLSASATLEDALDQSVHTLQDVFPVVRAGKPGRCGLAAGHPGSPADRKATAMYRE